MRRLSILLALALLAGCNGGPEPAPAGSGTRPDAVSPLGLGYPDPGAMVAALVGRLEAKDFEGLCALLAGPGRSGKPVPLVPGVNVPAIPAGRDDLWPPARTVSGLGRFLGEPWKEVAFGAPRWLRQDPPLISVPVRVTYHFDRIPPEDRQLMVKSRAAELGRPVTYEEVVTALRAEERAVASGASPGHELQFAFLNDRWRLYLAPVIAPTPSQ